MPKSIPISSQIPKQFKTSFLEHAEPSRYMTGDIIVQEGDYDRSLYLITEGRVEVIKKREDGLGDKVVSILQANDIFGEITYFFGDQRTATIRACEKTIVHRLSLELASKLMHNHSELYSFLYTLSLKRWVATLTLTLSLFSDLPEPALMTLITQSQCRVIRAGTRLYSHGDIPDHLYILLSGMLEVHQPNQEPLDMTYGQCLTPITSLHGQPSPYTASSISECVIATFFISDILHASKNNPAFLSRLENSLLAC